MSPTPSYQVSLTEAVAQLPELVRLTQEGAEILIVEDGVPAARLVPVEPQQQLRVAGLNEGQA